MSDIVIKLHERRRLAVIVALVAFTVGCCAYTALSAPMGGDYPGPPCSTCDYAAPPIEALATGHVGRFFTTQPTMGSVSLLLRVPVVAVARSMSSGELAQYRVGSLFVLLVAAALAWLLVAFMRPRGKQWLLVTVMLGLIFAGPVTRDAMAWGHPEELLGVLLSVLAVVLASRRQVLLAGISLGLALATKEWALLAIVPAVIACPGQRKRLLIVTAGVAALFILPMLIGDPSRFFGQNLNVGLAVNNTHSVRVTPANIWFAFSRLAGETISAGHPNSYSYVIPGALGSATHPLIIVLGLAIASIYWRLVGMRSSTDLLILMALVFLLRCLLDPNTFSYHLTPFFVAIACYETFRRRGLPIITIYSAAVIWGLGTGMSATTLNRIYLVWALPVVLYLGFKAFAQRTPGAVATQRTHKPTAAGIAPQTT